MATQSTLALLVLVASYPCERTGFRDRESADAGPDAIVDSGNEDASADAAVPPARTLRYIPEGCEYEVATPEVDATQPSGETVGPMAAPRNIHVSHPGSASQGFAVVWKTDLATDVSLLWVGTDQAAVASAGLEPVSEVTLRRGHSMVYSNAITSGTRVHEVHVCGLQPATRYFYKVGAAAAVSDVFEVSTAPQAGSSAPWRFAVSGDARNNVNNAWPIAQRRIYDDGADLQVFSGDAVFLGAFQQNWDDFFAASVDGFSAQDSLAQIPFMVSNGNHESLAVNYIAQFALPQQTSPGEAATGEEWYSFDYANAHFVVLNDTVADESVLSGTQASWLREDLARVNRDRTPWVFAVHHRPLYTCLSTHAPDTGLRAAWQPIFDQYEVDLVFAGHNHVYERSRPIRGLSGGQGMVAAAEGAGVPRIGQVGRGSGAPSGTLYLVSAGVGAPLYGVSTTCPETERASAEPNYLLVEIEGRALHVVVRNPLTGQVIDEFRYVK